MCSYSVYVNGGSDSMRVGVRKPGGWVTGMFFFLIIQQKEEK